MFTDEFMTTSGQTQVLDIVEQLESGIRYFDIRLGYNSKNEDAKQLYITHNIFNCLKDDSSYPDKKYDILLFIDCN